MSSRNVSTSSWIHPALRISLAQRILLEELLAKKMEELASSSDETSFLGQQIRFTALDGFLVRNENRMGVLWYHTYDFRPLLEKLGETSIRHENDEMTISSVDDNFLPSKSGQDTRFVWIAVTAPLLRFLEDNDYELFANYIFETVKDALQKKRLPTIEDFRESERAAFKKMSKMPPIFRKGEPLQPSAIFHRHVLDKILLLHRIGLPIERPIPLSGFFVFNQYRLMQKLRQALHLAQTKLGSWADESRRIFRIRLSNNIFRTSNYKNTIVPTASVMGKKLHVIIVSSLFAEKMSLEDLERLIFVEMVEDLTRRKYERAISLSESLSDILSETIQRNVNDKVLSVYTREEIDATRKAASSIIKAAAENVYQELPIISISQLA